MFRLQRTSLLVDSISSVTQKTRRNFCNSTCLRQEAKKAAAAVPEPPIRGVPYSKLTIGIPKEAFLNERRVSVVPATVAALTKKGFKVRYILDSKQTRI